MGIWTKITRSTAKEQLAANNEELASTKERLTSTLEELASTKVELASNKAQLTSIKAELTSIKEELAWKAKSTRAFAPSHLPIGPDGLASNIVTYSPLNEGEIRLVDFGAKPGEPVLRHVLLADKPQYSALSYYWGTENCLHKFELAGQVLLLTSSLYIVFKEVQRRGYEGKLWADAICIDQSNESEKSVQIPLMSEIYRNVPVIAWLGEWNAEDFLTDELLESLRNASQHMERGRVLTHYKINKLSLPPVGSEIWPQLMRLLISRWFLRLWTYQEAILAKSLILWRGGMTLTFGQLQDVRIGISAMRSFPGLTYRDLNMYLAHVLGLESTRFDYHSQGRLTIRALINEANSKDVSRPQDRIYALYSLYDPAIRSDLPIDTTAPTRHVYIAAAKSFYKNSNDFCKILAYAPSLEFNLPSWVPRLNRRPRSVWDIKWKIPQFQFSAGGQGQSGKPILSLEDDAELLGLTGFRLDTISKVEPLRHTKYFSRHEYPTSEHDILYTWCQKCLLSASQTLSECEDEYLCSLARTFVCDSPLRWIRDYRKRFQAHDTSLAREFLLTGTIPAAGSPEYSYVMTLAMFSVKRSFFTTRQGRIGLGPDTIMEGDDIIILNGGEVPYVARSRGSDDDLWEFIGECYVDGIMYGEAHETHKKSATPDQTFMFN